MRRFVCHVVVLLFAGPLCGQYVSDSSLSIRLFAALKPEVAVFTARSGDYVAEAPGMEPLVINRDEPVLIFSAGGRVGIRTLNQRGFLADGVRLRAVAGGSSGSGAGSGFGSGSGSGSGSGDAGKAAGATFSLSIPGSGVALRYYTDGLSCKSDDGIFLLLNETTVERYLPGLVRTEGGAGNAAEFNKAQSVIARTFAWQNRGRHGSDGYNLCDDVHCQAYHGMSGDGPINEAVKATAGLVITSRDSVLVTAAFHSNCGGETASSADVWLAALPHLQSVKDPYCTASRNALWRATISADAWRSFLTRSGIPGSSGNAGPAGSPAGSASRAGPAGSAGSASRAGPAGSAGPSGPAGSSSPSSPSGSPGNGSTIIIQQLQRTPFFEPVSGFKLPVTAIRNEFGLRSAFFTITASGDSLAVNGRGYGHGVGLCQEGAMEMAKRGHKFGEIISFYYKNVILMNVASVRFPPKLN